MSQTSVPITISPQQTRTSSTWVTCVMDGCHVYYPVQNSKISQVRSHLYFTLVGMKAQSFSETKLKSIIHVSISSLLNVSRIICKFWISCRCLMRRQLLTSIEHLVQFNYFQCDAVWTWLVYTVHIHPHKKRFGPIERSVTALLCKAISYTIYNSLKRPRRDYQLPIRKHLLSKHMWWHATLNTTQRLIGHQEGPLRCHLHH